MTRIVTALALIVLLLVPLAWWRGRTHADGVALVTPAGRFHALGLHRGRVFVLVTDIAVRPPGRSGGRSVSSPAGAIDDMLDTLVRNDASRVNLLDVRYTSGNGTIQNLSPAGGRTLLILPPWLVCLAAGVMLVAPALKRRHAPGHCRTCGYDLRGSIERCPECGTAIVIEDSLAPSAAKR